MNVMEKTGNIQMVDLKGQYLKIKEEVDQGISEVINNSAFINGQVVKDFEKDLSEYLNVKHVVTCGNGTDALQIALMALELEPGDEVITVPYSFIATAEVINLLKFKPVFVDVNPKSFIIDENKIEAAITDKTKCIIPVHLFGQAANMESIMSIAEKHNIHVVEDNAQALGADVKYTDGSVKRAGTIGAIGTTSFFPSKVLGGYGDGGAMFTNNDILAEKLRMIKNHGSKVKYYHEIVGVNSRLDSIQAAVLKVKLKYLNGHLEARLAVAKFYDGSLVNCEGLEIPYRNSFSSHVFHQYTLTIAESRNGLQEYLKEKGIPSVVYFPISFHLQSAFEQYGHKTGDFEVSEYLSDHVLSLPIHTEMNNDLLIYITNTVKDFFN